MLASIIVVAHNHLHDLTIPCIEHIKRNTYMPYELIFIDDASDDGTLAYMQRIADKTLSTGTQGGCGAARSIGMAHATGDPVVFVDNDAFVPSEWLYGLRRAYRSPRVGIAGAILTNELWRKDLPKSKDGLIDVPNVWGACMSFSRAVFERLGYLDPALINSYEDWDYCHRAILAGFRVVNVPWVTVNHLYKSTRKDTDQGQIANSNSLYEKKWRKFSHIFAMP